MRQAPFERREQAAIFGNVVGGVADALVDLRQDISLIVHDVDAVARGTGIAASPAVDVRGDHLREASGSTCCWLGASAAAWPAAERSCTPVK